MLLEQAEVVYRSMFLKQVEWCKNLERVVAVLIMP